MRQKAIAVLVSGGGTNLQAIMDACENEKINGKIMWVGSDNPDAYGLERARKSEIPTFVLPYKSLSTLNHGSPGRTCLSLPVDFDEDEILKKSGLADDEKNRKKLRLRAIVERILLDYLETHKIDVLVLAGFMKILSPYFLDRFQPDLLNPKVLNIHPALLPAFPGEDGYGDAWKYGVKVHGSTVHFVDYGEDTGPIIGQTSYKRLPQDTFEEFQNRGLKLEWPLYVDCLQLYCERRLRITKQEQRLIVDILPPKKFNPR